MPFLGTTGSGSVKQFGGQANLGYFIKNSLRFRSSANAYLSRTFGTPTNNTTWTFSCWIKRGAFGATYGIFAESTGYAGVYFSSEKIRVMDNAGSVASETTAVYRDPAAWAHLVVRSNGTNIKTYWNSVEVASYTGTITLLNAATSHYLARYSGASFDGYLAEINFIDGQALTPSSFGKTDAATNQWIPKKFAGTYGTNGFYLKFADASAATAAAIGKDSSGNGNNWTPNNISVTSGVTYDAMIDSPTRSAAASNYCTWNPLAKGSNLVTTSGNLSVNNGSVEANHRAIVGTMGMTTGKWYWEAVVNNSSNVDIIGVIPSSISTFNNYVGGLGDSAGWGYNTSTGNYYVGGNWASSGTAPAFTSSATIMIAYDADAKKMWVGQNGTWNTAAGGVGNPSSGTNALFTYSGSETTFLPAVSIYNNTGAWIANFGQRPFSYTAPSGFKSLNTFNLP